MRICGAVRGGDTGSKRFADQVESLQTDCLHKLGGERERERESLIIIL